MYPGQMKFLSSSLPDVTTMRMARLIRWGRRGVIFSLILLAMGLGALWATSYSIECRSDLSTAKNEVEIILQAGKLIFILVRREPPFDDLYSARKTSLEFRTEPSGDAESLQQFIHRLPGVAWQEEELTYPNRQSRWTAGVSFGYLIGLALLVPAISVYGLARGWRRKHRGLCVQCGYDLRATLERCPECGLVSAKSSKQIFPSTWHALRARPISLAGVIGSVIAIVTGSILATHRMSEAIALRARAWPESYLWFFDYRPNAASMRRIARNGAKSLAFAFADGPVDEHILRRSDDQSRQLNPGTSAGCLRGIDLPNIRSVTFGGAINADLWLFEMARPGSGLQRVNKLTVWGRSHLSLTGIEALSRPDSALRNLTLLIVQDMSVTDDEIKALTRPDSALGQLEALFMFSSQISDSAAHELAKPNSGLRKLKDLRLSLASITPKGLRELARPDTSLALLNRLELNYPCLQNDTDTLAPLARPDGGLNLLEFLTLHSKVTDAGLLALAQCDTALRSLKKLHLPGGYLITKAGIAAMRKARPSLELLVGS